MSCLLWLAACGSSSSKQTENVFQETDSLLPLPQADANTLPDEVSA